MQKNSRSVGSSESTKIYHRTTALSDYSAFPYEQKKAARNKAAISLCGRGILVGMMPIKIKKKKDQ